MHIHLKESPLMRKSSHVRDFIDQIISSSLTMKATDGKITLSSPEQMALSEQKFLYKTFLSKPPKKIITQHSSKKKLFDNENTPSSPDQNASDEKNTPSLPEQNSSDKKYAPPSLEHKSRDKNADKKNGSSSPKQMFPDDKLSLSSHSNGLIYRNTPHIKVVAI